MKNYNGRNSFPWIISINICLKLSNLFTVQDVLQQFYELKNTGNVLNDLHLKQHRQIPGTFQGLPQKKKKSLLRVNERPIPTSSGPDIPGRLHPDTSLKLPTQRNIFPYWKDWGIQTLKMEKKEENVGNNRKKNKKIKISVFRCPLGEKKMKFPKQ